MSSVLADKFISLNTGNIMHYAFTSDLTKGVGLSAAGIISLGTTLISTHLEIKELASTVSNTTNLHKLYYDSSSKELNIRSKYNDVYSIERAIDPTVPDDTFSNYSHVGLTKYLSRKIDGDNANPTTSTVSKPAITYSSAAFAGAAYHFKLDRIYFTPFLQSNQTDWVYVDCTTNATVNYTGASGLITGAYLGSVYDPINDYVWFVPHKITGASWHYINETGAVTAYTHGTTIASGAYVGGAYSPTQQRIYLAPYAQGGQTLWHYIDCNSKTINSYVHGAGNLGTTAYTGAVYVPTNNRIYFMPVSQGTQSTWHYVDCSNGNIVSYNPGTILAASTSYFSAVYSPIQNRIYLVPYADADTATWLYLDPDDNTLKSYTHGLTITNNAFIGGTYAPTQNRIYFTPANGTKGVYIDCYDGTAHEYTISSVSTSGYYGAGYDPTNDSVWFVPYNGANAFTNWLVLRLNKLSIVDKKMSSSPIVDSTI